MATGFRRRPAVTIAGLTKGENAVRIAVVLGCLITATSGLAEPLLPAAEPAPATVMEWNNARPEQRQALDHFYRSLPSPSGQEQLLQRLQRQQTLDQLRGMTPEQRQQQFLNFRQQHPQPAQH